MLNRTIAAALWALAPLLALALVGCPADSGTVRPWTRSYGGEAADAAFAVAQTADGGYILAGRTDSFGPGESAAYLVKLNARGFTQWERTYGGDGADEAAGVKQTSDGGYIIVGTTDSFGPGRDSVYLIKTDAQGEIEWENTYGGRFDDRAFAVQETLDGGYVLAGVTGSFVASPRMYVVKTDAGGNIEWHNHYGGSGDDRAWAIQQTSDGGFIMAGQTTSFGPGGRSMYLVKTNASGAVEWDITHGGSGDDLANSVQQTGDGGYIMAGWTESNGSGGRAAHLVKTRANGALEWEASFSGGGEASANAVRQTGDGGYAAAGYTEDLDEGRLWLYLWKTNAQGARQWERMHGGPGLHTSAFDVQPTEDGGYIAAGWIFREETENTSMFAVKTNSQGQAPAP